MRVDVADRFMPMPVTVLLRDGAVMGVLMVSIVMGVGMFMLQQLVMVLMRVGFKQMQRHAKEHQNATQHQHPSACAIAPNPGTQCPNERRKGKDRTSTTRAKSSLRQQVKVQTQAIARRPNGE